MTISTIISQVPINNEPASTLTVVVFWVVVLLLVATFFYFLRRTDRIIALHRPPVEKAARPGEKSGDGRRWRQ